MSVFSSGRHAGPLTNPKSWGLSDARDYRAKGNPKGWGHVLRSFEQAVGAGFYSDYLDHDAMVAHARAVLTRLANIEVES